MKPNREGFFQPRIDAEACLNCGKYLRLCPQENQRGSVRKEVFWCFAREDGVRDASTSGGVMRVLADAVLRDGRIVFGAAFSEDYRSVAFSDTDRLPIAALQRSKYSAAGVGNSFRAVKAALAGGRRVLFCGTPCQCAGLTSYLGKEEPNLLICDFVCGGMPSPGFYREHLQTLERQYKSKIASVEFRPKTRGWGRLVMEIRFENGRRYAVRGYQDAYYKAFGILHTSVCAACLQCRYSYFHASDLTLGDFWGHKAAGVPYDAGGLSLVSANTEKGRVALTAAEGLTLHPLEMKYSDYAFRAKSPELQRLAARNRFFARAQELGSFEAAFFERDRVGLVSRVTARIKRLLRLK